MPRRKIQFKKEKYYHIYNCGVDESDIFFDDDDKERFLQSMFLSNNRNSFRGIGELEKNRKDYSIESAKNILKLKKITVVPLVDIFAYCLMPNHFHFLLKEKEKNGISRFMQKLGNSFGKYFSKKYGNDGSVFAGRFKTIEIENNEQIANIMGYISIVNPAQIIEPYMKIKGVENFSSVWDKADNYIWSSHQDYLGRRNSGLINPILFKKTFVSPKAYNDFAQEILLGRKINIWDRTKDISLD